MTMETGYTGPGEFPWKTGDYYKESEVIKRVWSELEKMGAALQSVQGLMKPDVDLGPAKDNIIDQLRKLAETQDWINEKLAGRMGRTEKKVDDLSTLDKATARRLDHLENELRRVSENHTLQLDDSKRRAAEIEHRIEKVEATVSEILERLRRPETGEWVEEWTERQIEKLAMGVQLAVTDRVSEELAGTDKAVASHNERLEKIEHDYRELAGTQVQILMRLEAYGIPEFGILTKNVNEEPEPEFSPPVGGGIFTKDAQDFRNRIIGAKAMAQEQYDRGLSTGSERALNNAKHRVRTALVQMGWAPGSPSMEMVMKAIRG
jgi:archaellum component FlaC